MTADLTAIAFFACVAFIAKAFVDAWSRRRVLRAAMSEDILRAFLAGEDRQRRMSTLFWGLVGTLLAVAFAVIGTLGKDRIDPASIAIVLAAIGIANLVFFGVSRRLG